MCNNWQGLKRSTPYCFSVIICYRTSRVSHFCWWWYSGIQSHSTERLREDITPTTRASTSRIEPPTVATKSPDKEAAGLTPSSSSKLVDTSASASALEIRPLLSRAAYKNKMDHELHEEKERSSTDPCSIQAGVAGTPLLEDADANLDTICLQGGDRAVLAQWRAREAWEHFIRLTNKRTSATPRTYILFISHDSGNGLDGVTITPTFASPRFLASKCASAPPATVSLSSTFLLASTSFLSLINDAIMSAFSTWTTSGISPLSAFRRDKIKIFLKTPGDYLGNTVKRSSAGGVQQQVTQGSNLTANRT